MAGTRASAKSPLKRGRTATVPRSATTRGEFVYAQLREEIFTRKLRSGDRLREIELADRLRVSRTPVREALQRLGAEGLVMVTSSRGLVVTELTPENVMALYAMREILEGAAARFASERASTLEIEYLQNAISRMRGVISASEAAAQNQRLHDFIVRSAHNEFLLKAVNALGDTMALLGTTTYSVPGRIESGLRDNEEIVACIARRDADAAEQAARTHIRAASTLRLGMLFGQGVEPGAKHGRFK